MMVFLVMLVHFWLFFFFSSRRRHTRFKCDWSSDVCSSDLLSGIRRCSEFVYVGELMTGQIELYLHERIRNIGGFQITAFPADGFTVGQWKEGQIGRASCRERG